MDRRTIISGALGAALVACAVGVAQGPPPRPLVTFEPMPEGLMDSQIVGVVVDTETDRPYADATVVVSCECLQEAQEVRSNADGIFAVRDLAPGEYTVVVRSRFSERRYAVSLGERSRARLRARVETQGRIVT